MLTRSLFWAFETPILAFTVINLALAGPIWVVCWLIERHGPTKEQKEAERRAHLGDYYW